MLQESSREVQAIVSLLKPEVLFSLWTPLLNYRLSCLIFVSCCFPFFSLYIFNDETIWLIYVFCRLSSSNCARVACQFLPFKILRSLLFNLVFYHEQGWQCTVWYTLSNVNFCGSCKKKLGLSMCGFGCGVTKLIFVKTNLNDKWFMISPKYDKQIFAFWIIFVSRKWIPTSNIFGAHKFSSNREYLEKICQIVYS